MASEPRFIYYSTIHLSRREEILVSSIISLYNSKDSFRWTHKKDGNSAVVIVGSEAKRITDSASDPFAAIKKEQIVCILGDLFYPKNARAVVRIDLPIRALQLVEKLADIERNYINTSFVVGYVATNYLATSDKILKATPTTLDTLPTHDGTIDFSPTRLITEVLEKDLAVESAEQAPTLPDTLQQTSSFDAAEVENTDTGHDIINKPSLVVVDDVSSNDSNFEPILANILSKENALDMVEPINTKESFFGDRVEFQDKLMLVAPLLTEVATSELELPLVKSPAESLQTKVGSVNTPIDLQLVTTFDSEKDQGEINTQELIPPILNVVANTLEVQASVEAVSIKTDTVESTHAILDQEQPPVSSDKRIKLLRWPKSEVIQRHPGNAILATMVINSPMSVEDMAKQSDLPLHICQRFIDAVVESQVAEYVDELKEEPTPPVEDTTVKEVVSKRKGILYRIRSALGLLRR